MRTLIQPNPNLWTPPAQNMNHFPFYLVWDSKPDLNPTKVDEISPEEVIKTTKKQTNMNLSAGLMSENESDSSTQSKKSFHRQFVRKKTQQWNIKA